MLTAQHQGHTRARFSINTPYVISHYEHHTTSLTERFAAAQKMYLAGYPLGFIVAPIMFYPGWEDDYAAMFKQASTAFAGLDSNKLTFELIMHRFTKRSKQIILQRFPETKLDLDESKRELKWGKYGHVKYVYPKTDTLKLHQYFRSLIAQNFPGATIEYFT